MKIGFNINYFLSWMGGRSFLAMIINAVKEIDGIEVSLGLKIGDTNYNKLSVDQIQYKNNEVIVDFCRLTQTSELCIFNDIQNWLENEHIEIMGPSFNNQGSPVPFINYLPDFQHKYIPDYFDDTELATRELQYAKVLKNSSYCLVGDKTVFDDIKRFYPWNESKIFILPPFLSFNDLAIQDADSSNEAREIKEDYLIVCSQRWQHKRHDLVLTAFASYLNGLNENDRKNKKLIFTGDKTDYRTTLAGELFEQIRYDLKLHDNVIDLGLVERKRQLNLIKNANALVTASEFEGGIGASGIQEAMILGTPVVAPSTPIYKQDFPIKVHLCDFKDTSDPKTIFQSAFEGKLTVDNGKNVIEHNFKKSLEALASFFDEVRQSNVV